MQAGAEWIFPQYFLVGTDMVHHCIAEFLICPVNFKMLILFRDHFFDIPDRQRVKARRKLLPAPGLTSGLQGSVNVHRVAQLLVPQGRCISSFVFYIGMITSNLDAPPSKGNSAVKMIISQMRRVKRPGFDLGCIERLSCSLRYIILWQRLRKWCIVTSYFYECNIYACIWN